MNKEELIYCSLLVESSWRPQTSRLRRCRNLAAKGSAICPLHLSLLPVPEPSADSLGFAL